MKRYTLSVFLLLSTMLLAPAFHVVRAQNEHAIVTVKGAVKVPQRIELTYSAHLMEVIAMAGGFTPFAEGVITIKHADGSSETYTFDKRKRKENDQGPLVRSGDLVTVS